MKYQQVRNKLFKMFVYIAIAMFFIINIGHWVTYKPLMDRIDRFAVEAFQNEQVQFLTYIDHNARQSDVLMLKLVNYEEGVPVILEDETQIDQLIKTVDGKKCTVRKDANSYAVKFQCGQSINVQLKDLTKKAWTGGSKFAIVGSQPMLIFYLFKFSN